MIHPCAQVAADTIATLRRTGLSRPAQSEERIIPEFFFSWDPEQGEVQADITAGPDALLTIRAQVRGEPRWFLFGLGLGPGRFDGGDVIGLATDMQADADLELRPTIRSHTEQERLDAEFDAPLKATAERDVSVLLYPVFAEEGLSQAEEYQMLVWHLPLRDFELTVFDMSLFVLPSGLNPGPVPVTLASFAR